MPDTIVYNIKIEQGAGYEERFQHIDENGDIVPLTGYTGKSKIEYPDGTLAAEPTITIYEDTDEWGFKLTAEQSAAIVTVGNTCLDITYLSFDVLLLPPVGEPWKTIKGFIELSPGVTE